MARGTGSRGRRAAGLLPANLGGLTRITDAQTGRRVSRRRVQATVRRTGRIPGGLRISNFGARTVETVGRRGKLAGGSFG